MFRNNKARIKALETMDAVAMLVILLLASGIDTTEPMIIVKAMFLPIAWLLMRYFANR